MNSDRELDFIFIKQSKTLRKIRVQPMKLVRERSEGIVGK